MEQIHISLAPEIIGHFGQLNVTNALLMSIIGTVFLTIIALFVTKKTTLIPTRVGVVTETLIGGVYSYVESVLEDKNLTRKFYPVIMSIFLFILLLNWIQFIPGVGSLGFFYGEKFEPLLRGATTDLNLTLAIALVAFLTIEFAGLSKLGMFKYLGKFFNFSSPINFAVGIIDLFSELARLISFSFRLFGNIFAGEVIIAVLIFFLPILLPVPFIGFELFVGFIQAAIFALLTLFFIKIAVTAHH